MIRSQGAAPGTFTGGRIVNVASMAGLRVLSRIGIYAMSKAAVEQFGRALRAELLQHGASASVAYFGFIDTDMVHRAIDADPLAAEMLAAFPKPLHKRIQPQAAGEAIVRGIERRQPRIIRPRRWVAMSLLRGILNPLSDAQLERNETARENLRRLDARAGEDQPTTA